MSDRLALIGGIAAFAVLLLVSTSVSAYQLSASTDKMTYLQNETFTVIGYIGTNSTVNVTAVIYSSNGSAVDVVSNETTYGAFVLYGVLNVTPGKYSARITDPQSSSIDLNFSVVDQMVEFKTFLINQSGGGGIFAVNTSTLVTEWNTTGGNSNFTELINISLSSTPHYGNFSLPGSSKQYYMVLVDENYNGVYDGIYIDDDKVFQFYNDTEDTGAYSMPEKVLKPGDKFGNTSYVIAFVEFNDANTVILIKPPERPDFTGEQNVSYVVIATDQNGDILKDKQIDVDMVNKTGDVVNSTDNMTSNGFGFVVSNFTSLNSTGEYFIKFNDTMGSEPFSVESFKLMGKVTDVSDNPSRTFSPGAVVRLRAVSRYMSGDAKNLTLVTAMVTNPLGASSSYTLSYVEDGVYGYDVSTTGSPNGAYSVKITGSVGADTQSVATGFDIASVGMEVETVNMQFIDQMGGEGAAVTAFWPGKNVTIGVFQVNITAGGFKAGGPEGMAVIPIESGSFRCSDAVKVLEIKDDTGTSLNLSAVPVWIMNLSDAMTAQGATSPEPMSQNFLRQCAVMFTSQGFKQGSYEARVQLNTSLGMNKNVATFSVQKLLASGATVDFRGESSKFLAPNSSIIIKIKLQELENRTELPGSNITSVKIIGMERVFPSYSDVFSNDAYKALVNESIVTTGDGVGKAIQFMAPEGEGFHIMKFKFKANINGELIEGTGTAEFMLKKYMIWAEPYCGEQSMGWCMFGSGNLVRLRVFVMDIDKGSVMTMMGKSNMGSAMSCTGCEGLVVDIQNLFNDQIMKQMANATDYVTTPSMILGNNATLNITPTNLLPGWYGVDITLTDPTDPSKQYFGWGGFEIRNLMINNVQLTESGDDLVMPEGGGGKGGGVSPIGSYLLFGLQAFDPGNFGQTKNISTTTLKSAKWMISWPPPEVAGVSISTSNRQVNTTMCPPPSMPPCATNMTVVNFTGLPSQAGDYMLTLEVTTTDSKTDLGSSWIRLASYNSQATYRGMDQWPVIFSANEQIWVNFSATEFAGGVHNMTSVIIKSIFEDKGGMPIRADSSMYNQSCDNNLGICQINFSMSGIGYPQQNRMYNVEFQLNDTLGQLSTSMVQFQTRGYTIGVPSITEIWVDSTETATRELNIQNDRSTCENMLGMQGDMCNPNPTEVCTQYGDIEFAQKQGGQSYYGYAFNINTQGQWMEGLGSPGSANIYVISNGSAVWIKQTSAPSCNMSPVNFNLTGNRVNASCSDSMCQSNRWLFNITSISEGQIQMDVPNTLCGRAWAQGGDTAFSMEIPATYSTMYFGKVNNLIQMLENSNDPWFQQMFAPFVAVRPVYMFHNTTNVWMTNSTNMSTVSPAAIGGTIADPYGGQWTVMSINTNKVTLKGRNVLASTGAWINTSLTKSGYIKYSVVREQELGRWDTQNNQKKGVDLNADGYYNGTVYVMISDSQTAGVYDTFFISSTSNFPNAMSVNNNNMTDRTFGLGDAALTLLSIDPRADKVLLYSPQAGDWSNLGEGMVGSNVRLPIVVRTPGGQSPGVVNVSVETIRFNSDNFKGVYQINPSSAPRTLINISDGGVGEILLTNASYYSGGKSGEYVYGFKIEIGGNSEFLDEWKWPRKTLRNFLADSERGRGGYINGFVPLPLTKYSFDSYGDVQEEIMSSVNVSQVWNQSGPGALNGPNAVYQGIMIMACTNGQGCTTQPVEGPALAGCQFQPPSGAATTGFNMTLVTRNFRQPLFVYMNPNNESMFWAKHGNCNFSGISNQTTGSSVLINTTEPGKLARQFRPKVLYVNSTLYAVAIGYGPLPSGMEALTSRDSQSLWRVMSLTLGANRYDIALANDSAWTHTLCAAWNVQECAKKAWFSDTTGNLSNATGVTLGGTINPDFYLANIGPGPWEGITIGNKSGFTGSAALWTLPKVGLWLSDNTTSYFVNITEEQSGVDFNINGQNNDTTPFFILTFDGNSDGINMRNSVLVDDDVQITEDWWNSNMQGGQSNQAPSAYYEFDSSANESGVPESRNSLPSAIWSGQLCFNKTACDAAGGDWFAQMRKPQWDILYYNGTSMLIRKWSENMNNNENVTLMVRVYNQTQDPLAANITVEKIIRGYMPLPVNAYTTTSVITDTGMNGYGIVTLSPVGGPWQNGEYMVTLKITSQADGTMIERTQEFFRVGNFFGGGGGPGP